MLLPFDTSVFIGILLICRTSSWCRVEGKFYDVSISGSGFNYKKYVFLCEPGISVGIATDYGLDGPGIESRWGEIFRPYGPALGSTQAPLQWVPGLSRG